MLIEQIIEFDSRVPGPLVVHYIPKTGYFHDKIKMSKGNFQGNYLMLTMFQMVMYFVFSDLGHATKFNPKMQNFKCVLNST